MSERAATAVSLFHRLGSRSDFVAWADRVGAAARSEPGFLDSRISETGAAATGSGLEPSTDSWAGFDPATALTFDSAQHLHQWLDSPARARLLAEGAQLGHQRKSADIVVVDGDPTVTGVGIFRHHVAVGRETDFVDTQARLVGLSAHFSGFEGATLIRPADPSDEWMSVQQFRTDRQLDEWMGSSARLAALPQLRADLVREFAVVTRSTPFGSILRVQDGATRVTPQWKTAMLVLLVLYPTVMTLSRFLGPVLDDLGAEPWLSMWLSQIVSVGAMTWFLMPVVTGWFHRWLDPVDGAGARISLTGAAVVVAVYAVTLTIFASITWLQFWDYLD
jgi:antibiotic biosynthesis monooxygenase (ABM) superfamily enzyme